MRLGLGDRGFLAGRGGMGRSGAGRESIFYVNSRLEWG